jgi:hypothetical protein
MYCLFKLAPLSLRLFRISLNKHNESNHLTHLLSDY